MLLEMTILFLLGAMIALMGVYLGIFSAGHNRSFYEGDDIEYSGESRQLSDEQVKEQQRMQVQLENMLRYNGTGEGQVNVNGR